MSVEAGLTVYAAFACLAITQKRNRPTKPAMRMPSPLAARRIGIALLLLSMTLAMLRFGPAVGLVAWTGQLCVAGAILALLLSWRPRVALLLAAPASLAAFLIATA